VPDKQAFALTGMAFIPSANGDREINIVDFLTDNLF